jgi:transglutaminase-like putative cysteine protease
VGARTILVALASLQLSAVSRAQSPAPPDATIEEWHQHWTLNPDGSTVYHEHKRVRLNNDRAYGAFTDPRITFDKHTDTVEVITARVKNPRGQIIDTPAYSRNEVAPGGAAGWPAFASLRQLVLTLSGIEPGCETEVEYRITSKPGRRSGLAADLRLDHEYPIALRAVTVDVPLEAAFSPAISGLPQNAYTYTATSGDAGGRGVLSHHWEFIGFPAAVDEPHAPPWQVRSPRLCFSTIDADSWSRQRLERIDEAAGGAGDTLKSAAQKWAAEATGREAKVRAIQKKLAETFNFVEFDPSWRPATLRPAEAVFASGYGLPEEAAAVFAALLRAAGIECRPAFLRSDDAWCVDAPQDGFVAAYVVDVDGSSGLDAWHAQHGRIERDARWGRHTAVGWPDGEVEGEAEELSAWPLPGFGRGDSQIDLTIRVKLAGDGTYTGTAAVEASGLFLPADGVSDADRQKDRVRALLRRVLPQARVDRVDVKRVVPGGVTGTATPVFAGEVTLASDAPLSRIADRFALVVAQDGPHTTTIGWPPLARSRRHTAVRLAGPFEERIELTVEWPEGWKLDARPGDSVAARGDWGHVEQHVTVDGAKLTLTRAIAIHEPELAPTAFHAIRDVLNQLSGEAERTLLLKP